AERAPRAHVEAEEGADQHQVVRTDARRPEDARVRLADALEVVAADAEDGGPAGGAAGAVDARHLRAIDAEIIAEGRMRGLLFAQLVFLQHREARQIVERAQRLRRDARDLPLAPVEGA